MDTEAIYQHLFTRIPSELFHSPMLAFEFVQFCRDNLPLFGRSLGILKLSFPNLFKARAIVLGPGRELGAGAGVRWAPRSPLCPRGLRAGPGCDHRAWWLPGLGGGGLDHRAERGVGGPGVHT